MKKKVIKKRYPHELKINEEDKEELIKLIKASVPKYRTNSEE